MIRRYTLRRSDNAPKTGERGALVSGEGTLTVTTGFQTTSAIVSHVSSMVSSRLPVVREHVRDWDIVQAPLNYVFQKDEPTLIHTIALDFNEKSLDTTAERCQAIIEADRRAGGKTFVGLNLRYAPVYATIRRRIEAGAIGDVLTIQADEFYDGGRTYFRRWNRLRSEGGGLWITKATHDFDLLTHLAGWAAPLEVYAAAARTYYVPKPGAAMRCRDCSLAPACPDRAPLEPYYLAAAAEAAGGEPYGLCLYNSDSDTFDHGIATVRYENGVFATYTCNVVCGFSDRRIRVSGTKGTLTGCLSGSTVELCTRDPSETIDIPVSAGEGGHGGADGLLLESFLAFVRGECQPRCRPAEAAVSVYLGLAATKASDEHRAVALREIAP